MQRATYAGSLVCRNLLDLSKTIFSVVAVTFYDSLQAVGVFCVGQDITELRDAGTSKAGFQTNRSSVKRRRSGKQSKLGLHGLNIHCALL